MKKKNSRLTILLISICVMTGVACSSPSPTKDENSEVSSETQTDTSRQGVEFFKGSFEDGLAQAKKEGKDIFVFFNLTSLAPCVVMQEAVFPLPEVGEYFNERFVNFHVDIERNGISLIAHKITMDYEYRLVIYPAYLILDSSGKGIGHAQGRAPPKQLISAISRVIGESEPTFDTWQERYDSGDRSPKFVQKYLMELIEELTYGQPDSEVQASMGAFRDEVGRYKEIADAYFASKPHADLINETDAHLIMYFYEPPTRGEELVEFVLQHYNEFLAVSSETAMAQFTLHATTNAVRVTAQAGDEKFFEYVEALESYPLKQAVDHERTRVSESQHFPEFIKSTWGMDYLKARGEWDRVYEILHERLEEKGDSAIQWDYIQVARELVQSDKPAHHEVAIEYGKRAHDWERKNPAFTAVYVAALAAAGKKYSAVLVSEQYRKKMSRFESDRMQLNKFDHELSWLLERINEGTSPED